MSVLIDMEMPKTCGECPLMDKDYGTCPMIEMTDGYVFLGKRQDRHPSCPLHAVPEEIDIPIYDKETRIDNCTVQILENTKTGRVSIGWWRNE